MYLFKAHDFRPQLFLSNIAQRLYYRLPKRPLPHPGPKYAVASFYELANFFINKNFG